MDKLLTPEQERELWVKMKNAEIELAECQQQRDALAEVKDAAQIIFNISNNVSHHVSGQVKCPHGILPSYPTHAWWCDECWNRLEAALASLDKE